MLNVSRTYNYLGTDMGATTHNYSSQVVAGGGGGTIAGQYWATLSTADADAGVAADADADAGAVCLAGGGGQLMPPLSNLPF